LFNDAEEGIVAARVGTKGAGLRFGQRAAGLAMTDALACGEDGVGEALCVVGFGLDEVESDAFGGARADAGELGEGGYECGEGFRQGRHGVGRRGVVEGQVRPGRFMAEVTRAISAVWISLAWDRA
jgi:hypothetical protein